MKQFLIQIVIIFSFLIAFTSPIYASEVYQLDPTHTYVLWHVDHFGFSYLSGKFMAAGTLTLDDHSPQNSKVIITIDTANLSTGIPDLDRILKGSQFFDVMRYPSATFQSTKVVRVGKLAVKVYGILIIREIAKPVTLYIKLRKIGEHPYFRKKAIGFTGGTLLRRSDFGLGAYRPGVSDQVQVDIEAEGKIR